MTVNGKNENNNTKINLISKCISCSHKEVCKYKEEFEKFMEEIKNKDIKIPKMFNLDITCSKYFAHYRIIDSTPQIMPLTTPGIVPAPNYTPGIAPSITTPDLTPTFAPKITCATNDDSTNTATFTTYTVPTKEL